MDRSYFTIAQYCVIYMYACIKSFYINSNFILITMKKLIAPLYEMGQCSVSSILQQRKLRLREILEVIETVHGKVKNYNKFSLSKSPALSILPHNFSPILWRVLKNSKKTLYNEHFYKIWQKIGRSDKIPKIWRQENEVWRCVNTLLYFWPKYLIFIAYPLTVASCW